MIVNTAYENSLLKFMLEVELDSYYQELSKGLYKHKVEDIWVTPSGGLDLLLSSGLRISIPKFTIKEKAKGYWLLDIYGAD